MSDSKVEALSCAVDTTPAPTQSQQFWFEDGNIVLEAEGTLFRIHRSIMAKHFKVLEDMFSAGFNSTTPDQPRTPDGCPIIPLQDPQKDIALVLRIIYEPLLSAALWKGLNVDEILALHRFGMKYQSDTMARAVADRLHAEFPRKLGDFLAIYKPHLTHEGDDACQCGVLVCSQESLIKLIKYAMDSDLQAVLPVTYFLASGLSISAIISGVPISGGRIMSLSSNLQKLLLTGQRSLQKFVNAHSFTRTLRYRKDGIVPAEYCSDKSECRSEFKTQERNAIDLLISQPETIRRFVMVEIDSGSWVTSRSDYCAKCREALVAHYNSTRQKIWENLPELYGLPPWTELPQ